MNINRIKHVIALEGKETYCLLACRHTINGYIWELPETGMVEGIEGAYPDGPNTALALDTGFVVSANHVRWGGTIGNSYITNKPWVVDGEVGYHGYVMAYPTKEQLPAIFRLSDDTEEVIWVSLNKLTCLSMPKQDYRRLREYIKHAHKNLGWWKRVKLIFIKMVNG